MWMHPKLKRPYVGNYEFSHSVKDGSPYYYKSFRLEHRNSKGVTIGKVYTFRSYQAAKKAGWIKI